MRGYILSIISLTMHLMNYCLYIFILYLFSRFTVFSTSDNCFVTYNSDPLVIPTIQSYTVYYAPNTTEGKKIL